MSAAAVARHSLGGVFERTLRVLPERTRAPLARGLLRATPRPLRLSLAGRAYPTLGPRDHLRIVDGPLRGARWVAASGLHACLEGAYEEENQRLLLERVCPGDVVYDIGANVGFFTLLASRLVGPHGCVVSFEPFPDALAHLRRHVELNRAGNVTIVPAAVSDRSGVAGFRSHAQITMGKLETDGELAVDVVKLDDLCADGTIPPPSLLKVDVEGEELRVLRGATAILRAHRPAILLATHGSSTHRACCAFLEEHGYRLEQLPYETTAPEFDFLGELAAVPA